MALLCPVGGCGLESCFHNLPKVEVNDLAAELEVQRPLDAEVSTSHGSYDYDSYNNGITD